MHINDSDLLTVGIARVVIDWYRGKAKVNRPPASAPPGVPPKIPMIGESTCRLPYEIVEMIVSHLKDIKALKACSLTCHSWHTAAVPHIYHILILKERTPGDARNKLNLLSGLHGLGLTPHVKEIRVRECFSTHWFVPEAFSPLDLGYFSALANVHTLKLEELEIHRFVPGIEHYFGHFSQTLRSITLYDPRCTPRQLSHFLSLFPNLDDIEIWYISTHIPHTIIPDTELVPFSAPKLRGQLTLCDFRCPETWTDLITSCGGLRFRHMDLRRVTGCASVLLGACAETLETLRFYPTDGSIGELLSVGLSANPS